MRHALALMWLAVLPFALARDTMAQDTASADRIEEDWELVVASPDPDLSGPQVTIIMKPGPDDTSPLMLFNLNFRDQPTFNPGGLQVQIWAGDNLMATSTQGSALLQTNDETITWTQRMSLSGGSLNYKVLSGISTTWGNYGQGADELAVSTATSLSTLSGYDPATSAAKSGVSFESNRVTSLKLLQVRYYQGDTLISTDGTSRPVALSQ